MTTLRRVKRQPKTRQVCRHPDAERIKAPSMGHPNRWMCKVCGHRNDWPEGDA